MCSPSSGAGLVIFKGEPVQTDRRAGVTMPARLWVVNLAEPIADQQVRRFQHLVHGEHRGAGDAVFQAQLQDSSCMLHKPGSDEAFGLFGILVLMARRSR